MGYSVCSTLNPYSVQNIIGSLQEEHDNLNKIFPYDRQTNFSLWFNSKDGRRVINYFTRGFLILPYGALNFSHFALWENAYLDTGKRYRRSEMVYI